MLRRLANALVSMPAVYDLVQNLAGQARIAEQLRRSLAALPSGRTIDVGSSGGLMSDRLGVAPVFVDIDLRPLAARRRRGGVEPAVGADASRLPFRDRAFDLTLCFFVSHHLTDAELGEVLDEMARVTRGALLFADAVWSETRPISRLAWRYDRGRHPRTREAILHTLGERFEVAAVTDFAVHHRYLVVTGRPKPAAVPSRGLPLVAAPAVEST